MSRLSTLITTGLILYSGNRVYHYFNNIPVPTMPDLVASERAEQEAKIKRTQANWKDLMAKQQQSAPVQEESVDDKYLYRSVELRLVGETLEANFYLINQVTSRSMLMTPEGYHLIVDNPQNVSDFQDLINDLIVKKHEADKTPLTLNKLQAYQNQAFDEGVQIFLKKMIAENTENRPDNPRPCERKLASVDSAGTATSTECISENSPPVNQEDQPKSELSENDAPTPIKSPESIQEFKELSRPVAEELEAANPSSGQ